MFGRMDPALKNSFIGSTILGVVLVIVVLVTPVLPPEEVTVKTVPERIARLIIEKPKALPPGKPIERPGGGGGGGGTPKQGKPEGGPAEIAKAPPGPKPAPAQVRRLGNEPRTAPDRGGQGRARATQEVAQSVSQVTGSLNQVLDDISKALPASTKSTSSTNIASSSSSTRARRQRGVRTTGRTTEQLGSVGGVGTVSSADVSGSALSSEGISIATITDLTVGGGGGGDGSAYGTADGSGPGGSGGGSGGGTGTGHGTGPGPGRGSGSGGGVGGGHGPGVGDGTGPGSGGAGGYRSNESLLNVVRRYAPGIQFCYDNELKKNSSLRGKLVVAITVLASGEVSEASVVENTLGSNTVSQCVLAQIRGWHFPAIPTGVTSFRAPFVFTPPN